MYKELGDAKWHISDEEIAVKFIGKKSWSVRYGHFLPFCPRPKLP